MMKRKIGLIAAICLIVLLSSCQSFNKYPDETGALLRNGSLENGLGQPIGWWNKTTPNTALWTKEQSYSAERSIAIKSLQEKGGFSFWAQTIRADAVLGKSLVLKAFVRTEELSGQGAAIAIRGDDTYKPEGTAELFATSENRIKITGNTDWREYSVQLDTNVSDDIKSVTIYLILLPGTSGTVYFDQISLSY